MENILKLDDLTIERIVEDIFVTYKVRKKRKDIVEYYKQFFDIGLFGSNEENQLTENDVEQRITKILKDDLKSDYPYLNYKSPFYTKKKRSTPLPTQLSSEQSLSTNYIGKGGECLVMGELLFHGYNVNNMLVDEGIDLVASKHNVFYYIQVKTTNMDAKNRFYFKITRNNFVKYLGTQIRYMLVGRCVIQNKTSNVYFRFDSSDIERFLHDGLIPVPTDNSDVLSIKIEYDERTGVPHMYDGNKKQDISYYMYNFKL